MEQASSAAVQQPTAWTRGPCTSCQRSYKFYCPKCNIPLGAPDNVTVPALKLPLQVHVWFQDKIKKSTAPHAKVLAPQDVQIVPYPAKGGETLPTYTRENAVVVYPSFEAETLEQINAEELRDIRTLIFIDCPWQKAPVIMTDPAITDLRHVKLAQPPKESNFWRYHKAGAGCVSTIEAIQLMLEEYTAAAKRAEISLPEGSEDTQLSDLLFFFKLQFSRIAEHFETEADPERKPPMDADEKERRRLMYSQRIRERSDDSRTNCRLGRRAPRRFKLANSHRPQRRANVTVGATTARRTTTTRKTVHSHAGTASKLAISAPIAA
ncbi:DTW domain-containing protein [Phytophthora infestans]|uniref:tRNA-uridine aminocarboxypropyltransferase 1 n=1 Tax=Phytophthora infestans TaxID=4787 RepID=A0A833RNH0_PHYIN|nr:DTW domain-containing protein [Phytophthora infestans]